MSGRIVKRFFELIDGRIPPSYVEPIWLFPYALLVPGWQHSWDTLIQRGLNSLKAWPQWVTHLKLLVRLLRDNGCRSVLCIDLRRNDMTALAVSIDGNQVPSFAKWRW